MKRSTSRALWTILALAIVAGAAYWFGTLNRARPNASIPSQTVTETAKTAIEAVVTKTAEVDMSGELAYTNRDHDFGLTLPTRWKAYRVIKDTDQWGDHYSFELPRTTGGFGSVFTISAYPQSAWDEIQKGALKPVQLGAANGVVFAYSLGQDDEGFAGFPDMEPGLQYKGPLFDAQETILPSFKLK